MGRKVTIETSAAPWQRARASLRQMVGSRKSAIGNSGEEARRSRHTEQNRPGHAQGQQSEDRRQDRDAELLNLAEHHQGRGDEDDEEQQAADIEAERLALGHLCRQPQEQHHRQQADRCADEKDRAPTEMLGQQSAGDGAESGGEHRDRRQEALIARPLARRHRLADQRLGKRHRPAGAEPLEHPHGDQHIDVRRQPAEHRGHDDDGQRNKHQPLAAKAVAEPAIDRHSMLAINRE